MEPTCVVGLTSRGGSWACLQISDQAGKACQGQKRSSLFDLVFSDDEGKQFFLTFSTGHLNAAPATISCSSSGSSGVHVINHFFQLDYGQTVALGGNSYWRRLNFRFTALSLINFRYPNSGLKVHRISVFLMAVPLGRKRAYKPLRLKPL